MRLEHPIFKGPLEPGIELVDSETPKNYLSSPGVEKRMKMWKVQSGKFPDEIDVGLVSSPWGFEDSPDAEWISSGVNSKGPRSVALGRHGNWFLWGFAGDPDQMTESGRRVFINAVCYMKRFDGKTPIAPKVSMARDLFELYAGYAAKMKDADWFKKLFAPEVVEATGLQADKLAAWGKENLEWIRVDEGRFGLDADAKGLGVSNRKEEFFDAVLKRLDKDPKDEAAWRALRRYVPEPKFESPAALRSWLDDNRGKLFFSDLGGYRWFVNR